MRPFLEVCIGVVGLFMTVASIVMLSAPLGITGVVLTGVAVGMRLNAPPPAG